MEPKKRYIPLPPQILQTKPSYQLAHIMDKIAQLNIINEALKKVLPSPLGEHCRVANLDAGCLTLETESSVWATHLRFQLPFVLQKLRPLVGLYKLDKLAYYIQSPTPQRSGAVKEKRPPVLLSAQSGESLRQAALGVECPALKDALLRLASWGSPV